MPQLPGMFKNVVFLSIFCLFPPETRLNKYVLLLKVNVYKRLCGRSNWPFKMMQHITSSPASSEEDDWMKANFGWRAKRQTVSQ